MNPEDEIHLNPEQILPLGIFCFLMTLVGLLGNGTVVYSSLRYNTIRLDKVSLIFIQNLAVADILYTVCVILPQFATYAAGGWVLGDAYCMVMAQVGIVPVSANTLTVLALTAYRLRVVVDPFTQNSGKLARIGVAVIWVLALVPMLVFIGYRSQSTFRQENARCLSDIYENEEARIPVMVLVGLIVILPFFTISVCNVILCGVAVKHSQRMAARSTDKTASTNYRALLMVCALSGLFIVSWTPYIVFTFLKIRSPEVPPALDLLAFHCIFINSFGNPILYTFTNKRFGAYVLGVLKSACFWRTGAEGGTGNKVDRVPTAATNTPSVSRQESDLIEISTIPSVLGKTYMQ